MVSDIRPSPSWCQENKNRTFRNLRKRISYFRCRRSASAGGQGSVLLCRSAPEQKQTRWSLISASFSVMAGHSPSKDGRSSERPKFRPSTSSNGAAVLYTAHFWLGCIRPHHVDARRDRTVSAGPPQGRPVPAEPADLRPKPTPAGGRSAHTGAA
jgi:hypothetical protein